MSFRSLPASIPFKRTEEDPTRMFAGRRSARADQPPFPLPGSRLQSQAPSTAFDSVTLYGEDPHERPDVYGKVGNSGVSVATLDDAKKLYSGFDLNDPATSVSMTINGPAPTILAFFLNAAIDQACEKHIIANGLEAEVRGRIDDIFGNRPRPRYEGDLPPGPRRPGLDAAGSHRRPGARPGHLSSDFGPRLCRESGARSRPTSSRRTRPRTPASSRPSSRCG